MAGNYPDVPSWRMAYDRDGTQGYLVSGSAGGGVSSVGSQLDSATMRLLNDETTTRAISADGNGTGLLLIFPELRDLDGYFLGGGSGGSLSGLQVSSDTTNGADGAWTGISASVNLNFSVPQMRTNIIANTVLGIKAIRWWSSFGGANYGALGKLHLYGEPIPGANPKRLEIWHPTLDQRLGAADLDWGNVPRNSTETRQFRVKNMHPTLTANSVRVAQEILTDTSPSVVGQHAISKDGGVSWGAQQTIGNLAPGAISTTILQFRRTTPSNAIMSLWWERVFADCSSWS